MIINSLLKLIYNVFSLLTSPINIPSLPDEIDVLMSDFMQYINFGLSILAAYTHIKYLLLLFGIVVAVDVGMLLYKLVMWVIRKIPMLNID